MFTNKQFHPGYGLIGVGLLIGAFGMACLVRLGTEPWPFLLGVVCFLVGNIAAILGGAVLANIYLENEEVVADKSKLNRVLRVAEAIAEKNPDALIDLVRVLGRKLQSEYLTKFVFDGSDDCDVDFHRGKTSLDFADVLFDMNRPVNEAGKVGLDFMVKSAEPRTLKLGVDLVMAWPWNKDSFANVLGHIGPDKPGGEWMQDKNHRPEVILPFGFAFLDGGNHSIMAGIVQGQGQLTAKSVYDISGLLNHVYFDGVHYRRMDTDEVLSKALNFEFGAIFEIGRLMVKHGVSA